MTYHDLDDDGLDIRMPGVDQANEIFLWVLSPFVPARDLRSAVEELINVVDPHGDLDWDLAPDIQEFLEEQE